MYIFLWTAHRLLPHVILREASKASVQLKCLKNIRNSKDFTRVLVYSGRLDILSPLSDISVKLRSKNILRNKNMARTKHEKTEYEKCRRVFRSQSARHVLVLEVDM